MKARAKPAKAPVRHVRACKACGIVFEGGGPLPYSWDSHLCGADIYQTCSPECRKAANLPERKPGPAKSWLDD